MEHRFQFNWTLLVILLMMMTVGVTQVKIERKKYKKLDPGQNITGTVVAEFTSRSKLQCSDGSVDYS